MFFRVTTALCILKDNHATYMFLDKENSREVRSSSSFFQTEDQVEQHLLQLTLTEDFGRPTEHPNVLLRETKTYDEMVKVYKTLWDSKDHADTEDILLVDIRDEEHQYHPSFLVDWKAEVPMCKFFLFIIFFTM